MYEYINKMLMELQSDMKRLSKTPATGNFLNTNPDTKKLPEDKAQLFHHLVAKLLFLCRRTRQDIQTDVTFLCTRIKESDEDNYNKLIKVMQYIRGTRELTLTIEPSEDPKWWIDSSYAGHLDIQSHNSVVMSLGKGATCTALTKQKLNNKSSMEVELVAINNAM